MLHELAFVDDARLSEDLRRVLGDELFVVRASSGRAPRPRARSRAYPFNSQVLALPDGTMAIVAPEDSREDPHARAFLDKVVASGGPVRAVHYIDVRQSMHNGGGPACLRLRVPLTPDEERSLGAGVLLDDALHDDPLSTGSIGTTAIASSRRTWRDPSLARECMSALDELTRILRLGSVYDFQQQ